MVVHKCALGEMPSPKGHTRHCLSLNGYRRLSEGHAEGYRAAHGSPPANEPSLAERIRKGLPVPLGTGREKGRLGSLDKAMDFIALTTEAQALVAAINTRAAKGTSAPRVTRTTGSRALDALVGAHWSLVAAAARFNGMCAAAAAHSPDESVRTHASSLSLAYLADGSNLHPAFWSPSLGFKTADVIRFAAVKARAGSRIRPVSADEAQPGAELWIVASARLSIAEAFEVEHEELNQPITVRRFLTDRVSARTVSGDKVVVELRALARNDDEAHGRLPAPPVVAGNATSSQPPPEAELPTLEELAVQFAEEATANGYDLEAESALAALEAFVAERGERPADWEELDAFMA